MGPVEQARRSLQFRDSVLEYVRRRIHDASVDRSKFLQREEIRAMSGVVKRERGGCENGRRPSAVVGVHFVSMVEHDGTKPLSLFPVRVVSGRRSSSRRNKWLWCDVSTRTNESRWPCACIGRSGCRRFRGEGGERSMDISQVGSCASPVPTAPRRGVHFFLSCPENMSPLLHRTYDLDMSDGVDWTVCAWCVLSCKIFCFVYSFGGLVESRVFIILKVRSLRSSSSTFVFGGNSCMGMGDVWGKCSISCRNSYSCCILTTAYSMNSYVYYSYTVHSTAAAAAAAVATS